MLISPSVPNKGAETGINIKNKFLISKVFITNTFAPMAVLENDFLKVAISAMGAIKAPRLQQNDAN